MCICVRDGIEDLVEGSWRDDLSKVAPVIISISTGKGDKYIWIAQQTDYDKDATNEGKFSSYDKHKMRIKRRKDGPKAERMTRSWLKKVRDFLGDKKICSEGREEAAARRHNKLHFRCTIT